MTPVNNVTRLLDSRKINYRIYELPAEKLGALETARLLDVDPATVFKTIVATRKDSKTKPVLQSSLVINS
jgi:prolyl-tRNA editing enzyme YbaK/EbsC (Cys-tRNA(Pro) deacylase)